MNSKFCPKCRSKNIIPIIYGYPDSEMLDASDNDECILGGCCIAEYNNDSKPKENHCKDCGFEW